MIGIGDLVMCVNDVFAQEFINITQQLPKKDKIYTIRAFDELAILERDKMGVLLEEIQNNKIPHRNTSFEPSFGIYRFKKIEQLSIEELVEEKQEAVI